MEQSHWSTIIESMSKKHLRWVGLIVGLISLPAAAIEPVFPLPPGQVGVYYSFGSKPTTSESLIVASGDVPPGLSYASGQLSGVPTLAGDYTYVVLENEINVMPYQITILPEADLKIKTRSLPIGGVATSYKGSFEATGGFQPYTWTVSTGALPPGLTLQPGGSIVGQPSSIGNFQFTVTVTDVHGKQFSGPFNIAIAQIVVPTLLPATLGMPYSASFALLDGIGTFSIAGGSLPPGLSLSSNGLISGVPTTAGTFDFTVAAGGITASASITVTGRHPVIQTVSLAPGVIGQSYSQQIDVSGGVLPYTLSATGLPAGLSLSVSGTVSGIPTEAGDFKINVVVNDGANVQAMAQVVLTVYGFPTLTTASPLPPAVVGTPYSQFLTATGGQPFYSFILSNAPPPGLTLATSGLISGTPSAVGVYTLQVQVTDNLKNSASKSYQLTVSPPFAVFPTDLAFTAFANGDSPAPQAIVLNSPTGVPVKFSIQVTGGAESAPSPQWLKLSLHQGTTPAVISVSVVPGTSVGQQSGQIQIVFAGSSQLLASIPVTLAVSQSPLQLSWAPGVVRFNALYSQPKQFEQSLVLRNSGGSGPVSFSASSVAGSSWIASVTATGPIAPDSPGLIRVVANSTGLAAGIYRDAIRVTLPSGSTDVPVTLNVAAQGAILDVDYTGLHFSTRQDDGLAAPQLVGIRNPGDTGTSVNWIAEAVRGPDLISLSPSSGVTPVGSSSSLGVSLKFSAGNALGARFALVKISDSQTQNPPAYVVVEADISSAASVSTLDIKPSGLSFIANGTASASAGQQLTVSTSSMSPIGLTVSVSTTDGASWLGAKTSSATVVAATPSQIMVSVDPSAVIPGRYSGRIHIGIGAAVRYIEVTLIVNTLAGCTPAALTLTSTRLPGNFSVAAGRPVGLEVQVSDDCGNPSPNASVVAMFSNGDAALSLKGDKQSGRYTATWQPSNVALQTSITFAATAPSLALLQVQVLGAVTAMGDPPIPSLVPDGVLNNLNPVVGAALAPGTVAQLYGNYLADGPASVSSVPLPVGFHGADLSIGGVATPLFYVSQTQFTVEVPVELEPSQTYPVVMSLNGAIAVPQALDVVTASPGLATFGGALIAQHADFSLVSQNSPAKPNEVLTAYLVGMGATTPPVGSGRAASSDPLAVVRSRVEMLVDGQSAEVLFAGLTPGGIGLYQINFRVPASSKSGNLGITVTVDGAIANASTLPLSR